MADLKTYNNINATLSTTKSLSGNITVGTVNVTGADMSNYYDKEDVNTLLEGKSDVGHNHSYNELTDLPEILSIEGLAKEEYVNQQIGAIPEVDLSGKADKKAMTYPEYASAITVLANSYQYIKVDGDITIELPSSTQDNDLSEIIIYLAMNTQASVTFENAYRWQQELPELEEGTWYEFIFTCVNNTWIGGYIAYKEL